MRWEHDRRASQQSDSGIGQHIRRVAYFMEIRGLTSFRDATLDDAFAWRRHLGEHGQPHAINGRVRPAGLTTQRNHIVAMRTFWRWLQSVGAVNAFENPFDALQVPKKLQETQRAFTAEEVVRLFTEAEADEARSKPQSCWADGRVVHRSSLYRVLALTGMRIGEAARVEQTMSQEGDR